MAGRRLSHRLKTAKATATTWTTDSAASEKMAEDAVIHHAEPLPASMRKPTRSETRMAKRASRS